MKLNKKQETIIHARMNYLHLNAEDFNEDDVKQWILETIKMLNKEY